jgi:hypothetical protein
MSIEIDASDIAAGACTVELKSKIFHTMWNSVEKVQSSTWREMKAIELTFDSTLLCLLAKTLIRP